VYWKLLTPFTGRTALTTEFISHNPAKFKRTSSFGAAKNRQTDSSLNFDVPEPVKIDRIEGSGVMEIHMIEVLLNE